MTPPEAQNPYDEGVLAFRAGKDMYSGADIYTMGSESLTLWVQGWAEAFEYSQE